MKWHTCRQMKLIILSRIEIRSYCRKNELDPFAENQRSGCQLPASSVIIYTQINKACAFNVSCPNCTHMHSWKLASFWQNSLFWMKDWPPYDLCLTNLYVLNVRAKTGPYQTDWYDINNIKSKHHDCLVMSLDEPCQPPDLYCECATVMGKEWDFSSSVISSKQCLSNFTDSDFEH